MPTSAVNIKRIAISTGGGDAPGDLALPGHAGLVQPGLAGKEGSLQKGPGRSRSQAAYHHVRDAAGEPTV